MTIDMRGYSRMIPRVSAPGHPLLKPGLTRGCTAFPIPVKAQPQWPARPAQTDRAKSIYASMFKRGLDIVGASLAIVLALPVFVLLALALWIEGGNPFYNQPRLGKGGRLFRMLKLRTMVPDADRRLSAFLAADPELKQEWDLTQKLKTDPRITPLGRLIRKTSLDELPQLLNVLKGDMSLVGPRPMLPDQLPLYLHPSAYLAVRPGISGLWQVSARNDGNFEIRAEIDKRYVETLSATGDLRILVATVGAVVRGTGY